MMDGFGRVMDYVVTGLIGLITAIWALLNMRISEVKKTADAALPREEWATVREETVDERKRLREDVRELFARDDRLKDLINTKIDALREDIHQQVDRVLDRLNTKGRR